VIEDFEDMYVNAYRFTEFVAKAAGLEKPLLVQNFESIEKRSTI
jgi:hypothetical protein